MKTHTASMSDLEELVVNEVLTSGETATLGVAKRLSVRLEPATKDIEFVVEELYDGHSDPHRYDTLAKALDSYNEL
jgi:hypothetical protein